jgi:hypothetical protein
MSSRMMMISVMTPPPMYMRVSFPGGSGSGLNYLDLGDTKRGNRPTQHRGDDEGRTCGDARRDLGLGRGPRLLLCVH